MDLIYSIISKIAVLQKQKQLVFVAIDGRGGSGKTTCALLIKHIFRDAEIITTDDFLNRNIHRIDIRQLEKVILKPLSKGISTKYLEFDGKNRNERFIKPIGIIIVEGVYSNHSSLRKYFDLTIWIETGEIKKRVIIRDGFYDAEWDKYYRPAENKYIKEDSPKERADFIIQNIHDEKLKNLDELWKKLK